MMSDSHEDLKQICMRCIEYFQRLAFEHEPSMIPAAAAGILERLAPGEAFDFATGMSHADQAFYMALAAESAAPGGRREQLAALSGGISRDHIGRYPTDYEKLLVRVDPYWGWDLLVELIGEERVLNDPGIGLITLAYQEEQGDIASLLQKKRASADQQSMFKRLYHADHTGRLAVWGKIDKGYEHFKELEKNRLGSFLTAAEISSLLGGAAALDPEWALECAVQSGRSPDTIWGAVLLIARSLKDSGKAERLLEIALHEEYVMEQAYWLQAGVIAGAVRGEKLRKIVDEFRLRINDELDPGTELEAGVALLNASAAAGEIESVLRLALEWQCPAPVLIDALFQATIDPVALVDHPRWEELLILPSTDWGDNFNYSSFYWWDKEADNAQKTRLSKDILTLAGHFPWEPYPAGVADSIRWKAL